MKNYIICEVSENESKELVYTQKDFVFDNTRDAIKWVKINGKDGVKYTILKVAKVIEVETVQYKKVVESSK